MKKIPNNINSQNNIELPRLSEIKINILKRALLDTYSIWNICYEETENWYEDEAIVPNWYENWGYNILVPKGWELSCLQVLKLIPKIEEKLNINSQELYIFLAEILKVSITKFLKNIPENEHEWLINNIIETAISEGVPEEFINQVKLTRIIPTFHIKNIITKIDKKTKGILRNKNNQEVISDVISSDLHLLLENIVFKRWKNLIYEYLKIFNVIHRNAAIEEYRNSPYFILEEKPDWTIVVYEITQKTDSSNIDTSSKGWTKEKEQIKKEVIAILPIMNSQLKEQEISLRESFDVDYWKEIISNAPDDNKKTAHIFAAIESLRQLISQFPHDLNSFYWQNPSEIAKTQEMQCVWKSIVAHIFLEKLGISHKWCLQDSHIDIMIFLNWKEYLLKTNTNQSILSSENIVDNKKWKIFTSKNFRSSISWRPMSYQLWDPEYMCFFAMAWNIINNHSNIQLRIDCYKKLLEYEWTKPIIGHNYNLWNEYKRIWDLENSYKYHYAELKVFPLKETYLWLWNILFAEGKYLDAYYNYLNAIYFGCNINSWNFRKWLVDCKLKIAPNIPIQLSDKMKRNINWVIKTKNCSKKHILKALSYDPTNSKLWFKLWFSCNSIQHDVAVQLYWFFSKDDNIVENYVKSEVKDIFFQCIWFYHNWDYQKIYDLFCSLWDSDV